MFKFPERDIQDAIFSVGNRWERHTYLYKANPLDTVDSVQELREYNMQYAHIVTLLRFMLWGLIKKSYYTGLCVVDKVPNTLSDQMSMARTDSRIQNFECNSNNFLYRKLVLSSIQMIYQSVLLLPE